MNLLYLYVIFYILFFFFTKNKSRKVVFSCTLLMYLSSSLAAVYLHNDMYEGNPIYFSATIYHIFMFYLLLKPLQRYDKLKGYYLPQTDERILNIFAFVVISLCLIKMYFDIQNVNIALLLMDVGSLRESLVDGDFIESSPIVRYLNYFAGQYWSIALVLAFYYMQHHPQKRVFIILLLLSSLGVIVSGICVAAREYLIKYIYLFLILLYWFSSSMQHKWKKTLMTTVIILGGLFISFFLLITFLRFGDSSTSDSMFESLLSYLGQGYIYFSSYFDEFPNGATGGAVNFPLFAGKSMSAFNLDDQVSSSVPLNVFSTTIGTWYFEVGFIWTIIITVIHYFVFVHIGKSRITIFKLIYIIWIYDFIFSCMFFYNEVLNGSRILSILLILLVERISLKPKQIINKQAIDIKCK